MAKTQVSNDTDASGVSATITFGANVTAGNLIAVGIRLGAAGISSVTDNLGNTYNLVGSEVSAPSGEGLSVWYAKNIAGGACTITVTPAASTTIRANAVEFSGRDTAAPLDDANAGVDSVPDTNPIAGAVVVSAANADIFVALCTDSGGVTVTPDAGYTLDTSIATGKYAQESRTGQAAATITPQATIDGARNWAIIGAAFKAASGGGAPPVLQDLAHRAVHQNMMAR